MHTLSEKESLLKKTLLFLFLTTAIFCEDILVFSGNANTALAESIADELGVKLGEIDLGRYNDGEISIKLQESVRHKDVYIVQPTCPTINASVNDNLMELFLIIRTLKRSSAKSVTVVMPYYGYARQDRKMTSRVPISASDVARMLESAGTDHVICVDLHCGQIQGFFQDVPVDNLESSILFVPYVTTLGLKDPVVISPDAGGVERANNFRHQMALLGIDADLGIIVKQRAGAGQITRMDLVGDVNGKDAIIVDDLCDTGGTLANAAKELKKFGAKRVFACIAHPVFSNNALERLGKSEFTEIVVTDSIPLRGEMPKNITQLSLAPLLSEAIRRNHYGQSVSSLFLK